MKIYGDSQSGNCYKIQLLCSLLQIEHQWVPVDILAGDTKKSVFLDKNPNGKIPFLELMDGRCLCESNAIVNYLAVGSVLLPTEPFALAQVQQWQFFEQYSHEPYIAVARFIAKYLGLPQERRADYEAKQQGGYKALTVMENQLRKTPYLVGEHLTTADISLFAYTHVADEGGFDLHHYPAILAWLDTIKNTPNYLSMN
jgi:glutathione S-transferase|tara:strand:+ start:1686 stop:2282 length:597 start_codon:yes stop_codon:yes gene_type:complete